MTMSENFDSIFEELTPVTTNNRYSRQGCDLSFNPEKGSNGKFEVSDALFRKLGLNDNGFLAMVGRDSIYVGVVPNEEAVTYAGRSDSENKSKEFTSTELRDSLNSVGLTGDKFWLQYTATKDNVDYYQIVDEDPNATDEETEDTLETSSLATQQAAEEEVAQGPGF